MIVSVLWNYDFKFPNLITNSLSTGMSLYWIGTKFCVIDICDTDICDKRNSGIYLMTDPSAQGYPSLADGRTDRKISRTQETLHSCQSWNDQKPIGNHSPDFSVILAFWRICWWGRGGWTGLRRRSWAAGWPWRRTRLLSASTCNTIVRSDLELDHGKWRASWLLLYLRNNVQGGFMATYIWQS